MRLSRKRYVNYTHKATIFPLKHPTDTCQTFYDDRIPKILNVHINKDFLEYILSPRFSYAQNLVFNTFIPLTEQL